MFLSRLGLASWLFLVPASLSASETTVTIRTDFPGGNVLVVKNEGATVHLAPDLRGGPAWFYWHFEAEATQPGAVTFQFARPPMIGVRGPAVSRDEGKSWHWLGADQVKFAPPADKDKATPRHDAFSFTFAEAKQKVRFAVAIPYLQRDFDDFVAAHKNNPHLKRSILTQSRLGRRPVDLVQIGKPGPDIKAMLLTARHHACESMASYVLEGILREAMADSPAGVAFRKKYVLYAVPIVDRDGVEDGDQGKNRLPRDYNRSYGDAIYPEIKAIEELAELKKVQFALDLHCPFLRGDIHEAFHFLGLGLPHIKDNLREWTAWLKEERPQVAMTPLDLLTDSRKPNAVNRSINSHYFATRDRAIFAATLEVPYAQPTCPLDASLAREYGVSMLRAWVRTHFVPANVERGDDEHARLLELRTKFVKTYRSQPREAEELANAKLAKPVLRAEANNLMALLRLGQKRLPEAMGFAETAGNDAHATTYQKATSASLCLQIACADPKATAKDVETHLAKWLRLPYPALEQQAKAYEVVSEFFQRRQDYDKALGFVQKQREVAPIYEKGKLLNRMATLQDLLKRPEDAVASRKEAVKILQARLGPVPERSIFGALMTVDLFEALVGIPTATLEEKRAAANLVLDHEIASPAMKKTVQKTLAEIEAQPK